MWVISLTTPGYPRSVFEGTWRVDPKTTQFNGVDTYLLKNGIWHCKTCIPELTVKADGKYHRVKGSFYVDTVSVREMSDHRVEINCSKRGKPAGSIRMTVSGDGRTLTTNWNSTCEKGQLGSGQYESERVGDVAAGVNMVTGTWHPEQVKDVSVEVQTISYTTIEDGLAMHEGTGESYTARFDGREYSYEGDPGITGVILKRVDASTIEETYKHHREVVMVAHMSISPDGRTMRVSIEDKQRNTVLSFIANKQQ